MTFKIRNKHKDYLEEMEKESQIYNSKAIRKHIRSESPPGVAPVGLHIWIKNTVFHQPEYNHEYDVVDRNQTLKAFEAILDEDNLRNEMIKTSSLNHSTNDINLN